MRHDAFESSIHRFRFGSAVATGIAVFLTALAATTVVAQRTAPAEPATAEDRRASFEAHQALDAASPFRGLEWRSVGPSIQGGRVVDIESVPEDPFTFYIAIASGGVWKTENNGGSFTPLFDNEATIICGDLAIDPRDSNRLWLGTGENNSSRSSYGGFGVYSSKDGGKTWTHRGLADTDRIGRVLVDPRDSNRVYVAALGKLYTPGGQRGVFRTTDGGDTWKAVLPSEGFTGAIDLVMDPTNSRVLYAAMWERSRRPWNFVEGGTGSGIYKSTDGGDTWTRLSGGFPQTEHIGRIGLSISPAKPRRIYAVIDNQEPLPEEEWDLGTSAVNAKRLRSMSKEEFLRQDPDEIDSFARSLDVADDLDGKKLTAMVKNDEVTIEQLLDALGDANASLFASDIRGLQVWRSDDAGKTWNVTHDEPLDNVVFTYGYYFGQVRTDPTDADRIYVTGVPMIGSTDGGKTFTGIADRSVHVDHHEMWIDRHHPNRIIAGNDGGLDISYDYGKTWARMDKMALAQFYTIELDDARPYNIYGGTQDNGTLKGSSRAEGGDDSWEFIGGGDGMYVQIDPRDGTRYVGYQFGFYNRRGPGGGGSVRPQRKLLEPALRYNWCTPVQLSSHNQDIVWFGTNKLFRSMDQGRTWTAISPDLTRSPNRGDVPYGTISTVGESTLHFGLIWVGTDDGQVHVTKDGGATWRDVGSGLPADRWVTRVTPSRVERDRCYVSFSGYRDDDIAAYVFVTEDLGATWRSIANGLPAEAVNVIREDPKNADILWVGTDRGVYVSLDRGDSWNALPGAIPNVPVHDLQVHERDREVVAGTHGRSAYVLDAKPVQELTPEIRESALHVFKKPELRHRRSWGREPSPWYPNPDGPPTTEFTIWSSEAGTIRATILDDEENALARFESDVVAGVDVIEWDLLLEEELAIPVEEARAAANAAKRAEADEKQNESDESSADAGSSADTPDVGSLAEVPWAEALRLGRRLAVTPGKYEIRIERGDATATRKFVVK